MLFPLVAPGDPAGLLKTFWSVNVKLAAPRPASVETPTYTARCGPPFMLTVALSGGGERDAEVSLAGACAVIDLDLCRGVGGVGGRQAVRRRQGCRINGFARAGRVGQAAIVGALYIDVERGQVMVRNINRRCIAGGVVPHAVVTGDQRGHHIGRVKNESPRFREFVAVNPGAECQACQRQIGNRGIVEIRQVDGNVRLPRAIQ